MIRAPKSAPRRRQLDWPPIIDRAAEKGRDGRRYMCLHHRRGTDVDQPPWCCKLYCAAVLRYCGTWYLLPYYCITLCTYLLVLGLTAIGHRYMSARTAALWLTIAPTRPGSLSLPPLPPQPPTSSRARSVD